MQGINLKALEKKFAEKTLPEMEKMAKAEKSKSENNRRNFIEMLFFIDRSRLYKLNPLYKKSRFGSYLMDVFCIHQTRYYSMVRAQGFHPKETKKYGIGVVIKTERLCGNIKMEKAFQEMDKIPNPSLNAIHAVIKKFQNPMPDKPISLSKSQLEKENSDLKVQLIDKEKSIVLMADQIERLKKTVSDYEQIIGSFRDVSVEAFKFEERHIPEHRV